MVKNAGRKIKCRRLMKNIKPPNSGQSQQISIYQTACAVAQLHGCML